MEISGWWSLVGLPAAGYIISVEQRLSKMNGVVEKIDQLVTLMLAERLEGPPPRREPDPPRRPERHEWR